jgi:hypothetical protein
VESESISGEIGNDKPTMMAEFERNSERRERVKVLTHAADMLDWLVHISTDHGVDVLATCEQTASSRHYNAIVDMSCRRNGDRSLPPTVSTQMRVDVAGLVIPRWQHRLEAYRGVMLSGHQTYLESSSGTKPNHFEKTRYEETL